MAVPKSRVNAVQEPADGSVSEDGPNAFRQIQSLPFAYILIDPQHKIASVNPALENFLGQSFKTLHGNCIAEMLDFKDARLQGALSDTGASIIARSSPLQSRGKPVRSVDISISPIADSGGWRTLMLREEAVSGPYCDPHETGEAAFSLQSPDILAHEIKNPLAGIKGAAQLLERKLDGADRALTELIRTEVGRIAGLVDQMQSLGSKTPSPREACNIHEIISHVRNVVKAANPDHIVFRENFDPSLPPVLGASDCLSQIILNLLTNAVEACRQSEHPEIHLSTRYASGVKFRAQGSDIFLSLPVELIISDNGAGVSEQIVPHLFAPFVTSKANGQGLGLALVQKLVTDMQGRVFYDRDIAKGLSNFHLLLPRSPGEETLA